jgi:GT2 family glycosyltransferase
MPPSLAFRLRQLRRLFSGLPRRAVLTVKYHGWREFTRRLILFPLRLTPFGRRLGMAPRMSDPAAPARAWYRRYGRPAAVVVPTFGDPAVLAPALRSFRRTLDRDRTRVIVCDDGSGAEHVASLRRIARRYGAELVLGDEQRGFAGNCNRGLRAARPDEDVVLVNSDVIAHAGWLDALQHAAYEQQGAGITGAQLLYPDDTIQFAGMVRNPAEPEWFDHRYRGKRAELPEAQVPQPMLAVTGACMYVTRATLEAIGELDEGFEMAFEDVDYCLRAWDAGLRVAYVPAAVLTHHESKTRGHAQGERELRSQARFWSRWGDWLDRRDVRTQGGGLRIVYVTQDTGVGGGHRVIFTHLNGLAARGHEVELWTLADAPPDWFDLRVPTRSFADYPSLTEALARVDAIKVATWWETADWVWEASVRRGIPVYWVQDIETSYYEPGSAALARVLASYRPDFTYFAGSQWISDQLERYADTVQTFTPGLDLEQFRPLSDVEREEDVILALGRSNPLKDFPLTRAAYLALPEPRPRLWLFGIEPELADGLGDRVTYIERPSDEHVNRLLNQATVLLQTSKHEGFCLPPLEAMAAGAAVVCTDAHGNRDFCRDGDNCLMPDRTANSVRDALRRVLTDAELRARLTANGRTTAAAYAWPTKVDQLDGHYRALADGWNSARRSSEHQRRTADGNRSARDPATAPAARTVQ